MNFQHLMPNNHTKKGFIALISIIMISAVLSLILLQTGTRGYFTQKALQETEIKEQTYYSALSCMNHAQSKYQEDSTYSGNETIFIGSYSCKILPLYNQTVTTEAYIGDIKTTLTKDLSLF